MRVRRTLSLMLCAAAALLVAGPFTSSASAGPATSGPVLIKKDLRNGCLDVGGSATSTPYVYTPCQVGNGNHRWTLVYLGGVAAMLRSNLTGRCLDAGTDNPYQGICDSGNPWVRWNLVYVSTNRTYLLQSVQTRRCLDVGSNPPYQQPVCDWKNPHLPWRLAFV